jgi:hypothetical protein
VLIFCASKNWCEITAKHIAKMLAIPERSTPKSAQQVRPRCKLMHHTCELRLEESVSGPGSRAWLVVQQLLCRLGCSSTAAAGGVVRTLVVGSRSSEAAPLVIYHAA